MKSKTVRQTQQLYIESGKLQDLPGQSLQEERFKLGKMIFKGNASFIFECTDTQSPKTKLVVKFSSETDEIATEVKTLINLRKVQKKKYGKSSKGLIPKVIEFGMIAVSDCINESKLYGYCIMNKLNSTLEEYL